MWNITSVYRYEPCLASSVCFSSYQGIKHQSIKGVAVRVLHHDVEESIKGVLQELDRQMQENQGKHRSYNISLTGGGENTVKCE